MKVGFIAQPNIPNIFEAQPFTHDLFRCMVFALSSIQSSYSLGKGRLFLEKGGGGRKLMNYFPFKNSFINVKRKHIFRQFLN
jgi:hypothetical protein